MARRSARLKKRSRTPSDISNLSNASWETAQTAQLPQQEPPAAAAERTEAAMPPKPQPASQLPQPATAATPLKTKPSTSLMSAIKARTPKNRTPIQPAGEEMHPARHHHTTAKPLDEARWLGFQALGAHTGPPKASKGFGTGDATPSKSTPLSALNADPSGEFRFRYKSSMGDLSPKVSRILNEGHKQALSAGGRAIFGADEFSALADVTPRKLAVPKGKSSRFSDIHKAQFKKLDSIANHPSAFRADPTRFKPVAASLKRSPSKAELDKQEPDANISTKLKRTQSKMDLTEPSAMPPPTPLKRVQSKTDVAHPGSNLPRARSTVRMVPPSRDGPPQTLGDSPAKRFKRAQDDDAATTRPVSRNGLPEPGQPRATDRPTIPKMAPPRLASRLMTPTKSSLQRSQSVKTLKSTSMIPSLFRSPSKSILSPTSVGDSMKEGMRAGFRKTSHSLQKLQSILRTPARKYSDDPEKVAAGTHMSPPPSLDLSKPQPKVPATAPIRKQVNFSSSTLERASHNDVGKSPSPMKLADSDDVAQSPSPRKMRAASEVPSSTVVYPQLQAAVVQPAFDYPALPVSDDLQPGSPSRRLTFGGTTTMGATDFTFKSGKPINFGPASTGTVRMVSKSDAPSLVEGKKRKLDTPEESSDKENNTPVEDEGRSPKKAKMAVAAPPKTPAKTPSSAAGKVARRVQKGGASISKSRLAFLSTPKRSNP